MRTSTIKSIAAVALTGVGSALVLGFKTSDDLAVNTTAQNGAGSRGASGSVTSSGSGTTGSTSRSTASSAPTSTTGTGTNGSGSGSTAAYADGTWKGTAISEPWGPFQVQVVISHGAISSVTVVESPSDRHSRGINNQAVPLLTESVMASQGTTVDMVSGATWTSQSYTESLQSALDAAAKAA